MASSLQYFKNVARRARDNSLLRDDSGNFKRLEKDGRVTYGPGSYGIPKILTYMYGTEGLRVGNYSSIGGTILLGGKHAVDRVTTTPLRILFGMEGAGEDGYPTPTGDTHIGSDVWNCAGSLVMSGVTIGDGAIVAGGAVVTKDVEPYAIVGGNPAKFIKWRFPEEQREALLEIKWWNWSEDEVREAVPLLCGKDIDAFIAYARDKSNLRPTS